MTIDTLKNFKAGGMDGNSAYEEIAPNDFVAAYNARTTGTGNNEAGYVSNPESTVEITTSPPTGINKGIGGGSFEDINAIVYFRYNSAGNNQIVYYDHNTNTEAVIYEDLTNSAGIPLLPLNPQNYVKAILINKTYLVWTANGLEVGYTNLNTLKSGGYGTVLAEDLSLLKPQCMIPPTGTYGSDTGQAANYLFGKLPQFTVQFVNNDYNYSAWSTRSKRIVPYQQNTPALGADVTANNYIIVSVNIGSARAQTINIACQFDDSGVFSTIKSVDRNYVTALPNTSVNVAMEVYEAYNPSTNIYSFAFYNNTVSIPVTPTETDLFYDYIWPTNAAEVINGNLIALGDFQTLYSRPATASNFVAVGYNPNIGIPAGTYANPLKAFERYAGASGSGAGNHRRNMYIALSGSPQTNDTVILFTADIRNSSATRNYSYQVPSAQNGNLLAVVQTIAQNVGGSYVAYGAGYKINWTDVPYYGLQTFGIALYFAGASVANSVPTFLHGTAYQAAWSYFDSKCRPLPLDTDNTFKFSTPSYAQVNGNAVGLSWSINSAPPIGATSYQLMVTKPPVTKVLDTMGTILNYLGSWDARTNTPTLAINSGNIGDTRQITTPFSLAAQTSTVPYTNLGTGEDYNTGDYITNIGGASGGAGVGQYYKVLPKTFGNLAGTGSILVFSLNSLSLLNSEYSTEGVDTNLVYDFAEGDRCTLHYWIDGSGVKNFFNQPCIDLSVLGYDAATNLVKVENSAALTNSGGNILYNGQQINARNVFLRLYSPQKQVQTASTTENETVWYEIGERFTITNGSHDVTNGITYDGGAYYKTRQFPDAILPYSNPPVQTLATDLNYSDFYPSAFASFGRARTYYDELEQTEQKASIITSQPYILGSKKNGLNRFYPENIYGDGSGQTSSSHGAIQVLWQRGDVLVVIQEHNIFYIPVNYAYQVLNEQLTGIAISEKLLNNGRYDPRSIGIGTLKESFCFHNDTGYIINPYLNEPFEITLGGTISISGKMSQFFKQTIALAVSQGKKIVQFYNKYYDEVMTCIETDGGILTFYPFSSSQWNTLAGFSILPAAVTATPNPTNATASYNATTGLCTYTPNTNFVGNNVATFTFTAPGGPYTRNLCLNWTSGTTTVNAFGFTPITGQPLSTLVTSNQITVAGPNIAVAISITGGQYSINGGAYTSSAGTTVANDVITVQQTTSGSNSTTTNAVLTIGGTSGTFAATTLAASAGNYQLYAQYGLTFTSVVNGTCTGTPAAFGTISLSPPNILYAAYTTIGAGTVSVTVSGSPAIPGHTELYLQVGGSVISTAPVTSPGTYTLTFSGTVNDPTAIVIGVQTY